MRCQFRFPWLTFSRFRGDSAAILWSALRFIQIVRFYSISNRSDCDFVIWASKVQVATRNGAICRFGVCVCVYFFHCLQAFFPQFEFYPLFAETQKELKWPKSDSKVTPADRPQSDPNWLKSDSRPQLWIVFESLLSPLGSLWGAALGVTFGSL